MTTALARIADATGYDQAKVELVKDTIARGASDDELMLFLHLAQRSGLDPFSRQIYLIERRANVDGQWKTSRQPQTGIDGLRLIADRTGNYAPGRAPTYTYDQDGGLMTATAYVKKWVRGEWHEVAATAHYHEYVQAKRDGSPTQMWADKPHIMLAKCAEALALRRAFPAEMSGLYTADEMRDSAQPALPVDVQTGEIIDPRRTKILERLSLLIADARGLGLDVGEPADDLTSDELLRAGKALKARIDARRQQLDSDPDIAAVDAEWKAETVEEVRNAVYEAAL